MAPSAGAAGTGRLGRQPKSHRSHKPPAAAQLGEAARAGVVSGHPAPAAAFRQLSTSFFGAEQKQSTFPGGLPGPGRAAAATSLPKQQQVPVRSAPLLAAARAEGCPVLGCALARQRAGHAALPAGTGDARADRRKPMAPRFPQQALPGGFLSCHPTSSSHSVLGRCVPRQPCSCSWPHACAYLQRVW